MNQPRLFSLADTGVIVRVRKTISGGVAIEFEKSGTNALNPFLDRPVISVE